MAIVQRFGGGFPFFSVFYVCFYKKMGRSSGFSAWGARVEKRRGLLRIPLKMSKFISNFNRGVIWIIRN